MSQSSRRKNPQRKTKNKYSKQRIVRRNTKKKTKRKVRKNTKRKSRTYNKSRKSYVKRTRKKRTKKKRTKKKRTYKLQVGGVKPWKSVLMPKGSNINNKALNAKMNDELKIDQDLGKAEKMYVFHYKSSGPWKGLYREGERKSYSTSDIIFKFRYILTDRDGLPVFADWIDERGNVRPPTDIYFLFCVDTRNIRRVKQFKSQYGDHGWWWCIGTYDTQKYEPTYIDLIIEWQHSQSEEFRLVNYDFSNPGLLDLDAVKVPDSFEVDVDYIRSTDTLGQRFTYSGLIEFIKLMREDIPLTDEKGRAGKDKFWLENAIIRPRDGQQPNITGDGKYNTDDYSNKPDNKTWNQVWALQVSEIYGPCNSINYEQKAGEEGSGNVHPQKPVYGNLYNTYWAGFPEVKSFSEQMVEILNIMTGVNQSFKILIDHKIVTEEERRAHVQRQRPAWGEGGKWMKWIVPASGKEPAVKNALDSFMGKNELNDAQLNVLASGAYVLGTRGPSGDGTRDTLDQGDIPSFYELYRKTLYPTVQEYNEHETIRTAYDFARLRIFTRALCILPKTGDIWEDTINKTLFTGSLVGLTGETQERRLGRPIPIDLSNVPQGIALPGTGINELLGDEIYVSGFPLWAIAAWYMKYDTNDQGKTMANETRSFRRNDTGYIDSSFRDTG